MGLDADIIKNLEGFQLKINLKMNDSTFGLLGVSGSGKSMTLKCISGIESPDSGRIVLNDRVLFDSEKKINVPIRERRVGFLFQNYALFPNMTVEQNISFGLDKSISKSERHYITQKELDVMQLNGMEKRFPCELSGGQQQRVALARALVVQPEILLLDEPFSALDEHLRNHMIRKLKSDIADFKGTTIFVTHNMEEAYSVCENIVILSDGKIVDRGLKQDIFNRPNTTLSARLTGCKNISHAEKVSNNLVRACDWGLNITVCNEILEKAQYIGIRSQYFHMAELSTENNENIFDCFPVFTEETLFRMKVYLKFNIPPKNREDYHVLWDISKEEWNKIKNMPLPLKIKVNPENVIIMKE